jgi:hypothetical protein
MHLWSVHPLGHPWSVQLRGSAPQLVELMLDYCIMEDT